MPSEIKGGDGGPEKNRCGRGEEEKPEHEEEEEELEKCVARWQRLWLAGEGKTDRGWSQRSVCVCSTAHPLPTPLKYTAPSFLPPFGLAIIPSCEILILAGFFHTA